MKTLHLYSRLFAALACTIGLAACGGNTKTVTVGGTLTGLTASGLVLSNGVSSVKPAVNAVSYTFSGSIGEGSSYTVGVLAQPTGMTCTFANGSTAIGGVASGTDITNVNLSCVQSSFDLSGTVSGLLPNGVLVLANGSATLSITANGNFTFSPAKIVTGFPYGVTVLSQPAGQSCSVANGTGIAATSDVTIMQVTCL